MVLLRLVLARLYLASPGPDSQHRGLAKRQNKGETRLACVSQNS